MCRKGENIHKRKDGRWEARIQITTDGIPKLKSLYGRTYHEAKEKLLNAKSIHSSTAAETDNRKLFKEIADEWYSLQIAKHKGATLLKYHTVIESHIMPVFGSMPVNAVREQKIAEFIAKKTLSGNLKTGEALSTSYVRLLLIILTSILEYSSTMGYSQVIKYSFVTKMLNQKSETKVLNSEARTALENYILKCVNPTSAGIALAIYGGLRIGEVCALNWADVDLKNNILHIRHTISRVKRDDESAEAKTKLIVDEPKTHTSKRDIPINSKLLEILVTMHNISKSDYVVSTQKDYVSPRTFEYRFHKELEKAGVSNINFHGLRHTFATRCIEVGMDIKTISELLGHASVNITLNTYVHSSLERKRIEIEKLTLSDV